MIVLSRLRTDYKKKTPPKHNSLKTATNDRVCRVKVAETGQNASLSSAELLNDEDHGKS